ncbi:hypothetical protein FTX61_01535 [Nitriliruptoraceae bacterium ZYF776]|nr:hypothetical protein [Profundirhabdus halotolerans]
MTGRGSAGTDEPPPHDGDRRDPAPAPAGGSEVPRSRCGRPWSTVWPSTTLSSRRDAMCTPRARGREVRR